MLARLPGLNVMTSMQTGVDVLHVRPSGTDSIGLPDGTLQPSQTLVQPKFGYFVGGSFLLDPIAIGIGVYTLGNAYRPNSAPGLQYQLADNGDWGCALNPSAACPSPPFGGAREARTDWTISLAWNAFDRLQLGLSVQIPRLNVQLARDEDTALSAGPSGFDCDGVSDAVAYDPRCARRLVYEGRSKLRWFGLAQDATNFDFGLTVGIAFNVADDTTLGLRYRTQPLLERGRLSTVGRARLCRPPGAKEVEVTDGTETCGLDSSYRATWNQRIPRELALGLATRVGANKAWSLDANLYWIDHCPGGVAATECDGRDIARLTIQGLDAQTAILSEAPIYRGSADRYGTELYAGYDLDTYWTRPRPVHLRLLLSGGFDSPAVRPGAITVSRYDTWTVRASAGASFEIEQRLGSLFLAPGYALDLVVPTTVGRGDTRPLYDPSAFAAFASSGLDLNDASAEAVLAGRARPTNAGRYTAHAHAVLFSLRWAERSRLAASRGPATR